MSSAFPSPKRTHSEGQIRRISGPAGVRHTLSANLDAWGSPIGLTGKLSGSSGSWGIWFDVIVGEGDVIDAGRYQLDTWNVFGNQGEYPDGFLSDGNDLTGYRWWRSRNTPVRVFKWAPGAKKNDLYTHKTTCGYFDPGSEFRLATNEIFAKPAPAEG